MKCPKCGHMNPEGTLFCEECDWRVDQPARRARAGFDMLCGCYLSAVLGAASVVCLPLGQSLAALIFGAAGLAIGVYSQTKVRVAGSGGRAEKALVAVSGAAVLASVIGFIFGIAGLA